MYSQHQPMISRWARDHPDNFREVLKFVVLTVKVPLARAVADLHGLQSDHPEEWADAYKSAVYGWKGEALANIETNYERIFADCEALYTGHLAPDDQAAELLAYMSQLYGFGFAKGGFVLQLVYGLSGCLDTHNLARFGIPEGQFRSRKLKTAKGRARVCRAYNDMVNVCGGTEGLWDTWCHYVADNQPARYSTAYAVSALHAEAFDLT